MAKLNLYSPSGVKKTPLTVADKLFKAKVNSALIAQAVRVYLSNQRSGSAQSKTRNDINVTHAKVWKQKGTGRARHGSRNAPTFVGGAKAHGPSGEQNYALNLSKKMARAAIISALSRQFKADHILAIDGLDKLTVKTKTFDQVFNKIVKPVKKILLLLDKPSVNLQRSTRNLNYLTTMLAANLNVYVILNAKTLVFTPEAIKALEIQYK